MRSHADAHVIDVDEHRHVIAARTGRQWMVRVRDGESLQSLGPLLSEETAIRWALIAAGQLMQSGHGRHHRRTPWTL